MRKSFIRLFQGSRIFFTPPPPPRTMASIGLMKMLFEQRKSTGQLRVINYKITDLECTTATTLVDIKKEIATRQMSLSELEFQSKITNSRLKDLENVAESKLTLVHNELKITNDKLDQLISEFKGFSGNIAKSNEHEIVECVRQHFLQNGENVLNVILSHKYLDRKGAIICEVDGLLALNDRFAVVEAKSRVCMKAITQLERACRIVSRREGREVVGFLGGFSFPPHVKHEALKRSINVVELSGGRYRVASNRRQRPTEKIKMHQN